MNPSEVVRRAGRVAARMALPVLVGLVGAWLGIALLAHERVSLGPFRVELSARLGDGATHIGLPPLGELAADTHTSPLSIHATLVDAGIEELTGRYRNVGTSEIVADVERDALARIGPFAWRLAGAAVLGGAVLGLVAFRRRLRSIGIAAAAALLAVGGVELAAWQTFRPQAFLAPTFSGSLAIAPQLVGPVQEATGRIDDFRAELTRIVNGALRVYDSLPAAGLFSADDLVVLHISDVHLSPLGLEFARQVADAFDVDLVIDTGDVTSFGTGFESAFLSMVRRFDRPYLLAPGNHDAPSAVRALDAIPNATALEGRVEEVAGLRIYGRRHPAFTPDKEAVLDDAAVEQLARAEAEDIARDLAGEEPPDIVAVHDDRMVEALAGSFPLVVSGHFHETAAREEDGTIFLRVGSTGGAGFTVFTRDGGEALVVQLLYLSQERPHRLLAWDVISQSPETGDFVLDRHLPEELLGDEEPEAGPSP